jgi:hypothetical protein
LLSFGSLLAAVLLVGVAGCRSHVLLVDGGPGDSGPPTNLDTDGDGLCDLTEYDHHTDPNSVDTDGDGFWDYVEVQNGSDPLDLTVPERMRIVSLAEETGSLLDMPVTFRVSGVGQTFSGQTVGQQLGIPDDGTTASDFYASMEGTFASPPENVRGGIVGPSFLGVLGRTVLGFTIHFRAAQPPRGCLRAYPFLIQLKADNGTFWANEQHWLQIGPADMQVGAPDARWCGPVTATCF